MTRSYLSCPVILSFLVLIVSRVVAQPHASVQIEKLRSEHKITRLALDAKGIPTFLEGDLTPSGISGDDAGTLNTDESTAGYHSLIWDGRNGNGEYVASGAYLVRFSAEGKALMKKILLLR